MSELLNQLEIMQRTVNWWIPTVGTGVETAEREKPTAVQSVQNAQNSLRKAAQALQQAIGECG